MPTADLLCVIETFYDAVPRDEAQPEHFGPLTLFVRRTPGFPYYVSTSRSVSSRWDGHDGATTGVAVGSPPAWRFEAVRS